MQSGFSPRIVVLDDIPLFHEVIEPYLQLAYVDATILNFTDPNKAWAQLLRQDPDVFITDWCHRPLPGKELLERLAVRKAKYPIFVLSAYAKEEQVRAAAGPDLNVSLLSKPFKVEDLYGLLRVHVGPLDLDVLR